jgi:hypothetical protein
MFLFLAELLFLVHTWQIPIYARAQDLTHLLELKKAGATDAILENAEVRINQFPFGGFHFRRGFNNCHQSP